MELVITVESFDGASNIGSMGVVEISEPAPGIRLFPAQRNRAVGRGVDLTAVAKQGGMVSKPALDTNGDFKLVFKLVDSEGLTINFSQ